MEFTEERKNKVEKMIVDASIDALEAGVIQEADLQPIAQFVLTRIDDITNQKQLATFLEELAAKWPFFHPVERFLEGEAQKEEEHKSVDIAEQLVKHGNIDQALGILRAAEEKGGTV